MAAATAVIGGISAAIGAAGGLQQMIGGAKQKRAAINAARRFRRQELTNLAEGRQVSTLGADLARQEMARTTATSVGALQAGGIRGVVGGLGAIQESTNRGAQQIGLQLDQQQQQIEQQQMQESQNIRAMQEQRDNQELANLQAQANAGAQMQQQGMAGIAQTGMSFAQLGASGAFGEGSGSPTDVSSATSPSSSSLGFSPSYQNSLSNPLSVFGQSTPFTQSAQANMLTNSFVNKYTNPIQQFGAGSQYLKTKG